MLSLGFQYTMLTVENLAIRSAAERSGAKLSFINDEQELFPLNGGPLTGMGAAGPKDFPEGDKGAAPIFAASTTNRSPSGPSLSDLDVLLARSSSLTRSMYVAYLAEASGVAVVNSYTAQKICGDKALCSTLLSKAKIPTPNVLLAFSPKAALAAVEKMGYPCVIKPPVGSWGRMVCKITDKHAADAVISLKDSLGSYTDKVYYVQQYVDKPARDIRVFVVGGETVYSVYRHASHEDMFVTNLNAGAISEEFQLPADMAEVVSKVSDVLGLGIYGIDIVEEKSGGFSVLEVNHAPEFSKAVKNKIPQVADKIVQFALAQAKS